MFLLLSVTKVPCLLTMKSTSLEGYLRKESKGPCNSRFAISLHTIGINSVSSKGTAAVVKNLQQDLVDFFLWQFKGRKVSVVILLGSYLPSVSIYRYIYLSSLPIDRRVPCSLSKSSSPNLALWPLQPCTGMLPCCQTLCGSQCV